MKVKTITYSRTKSLGHYHQSRRLEVTVELDAHTDFAVSNAIQAVEELVESSLELMDADKSEIDRLDRLAALRQRAQKFDG